MNLTDLQQDIATRASKAPRVLPEDVENAIASEHYFTAAQGDAKAMEDAAFVGGSLNGAAMRPVPQELSLLTICVLVLKNGFTVTGESACASPENIGRRVARQNAINKVWPLLGFRLRDKLHVVPTTHIERMEKEMDELSERLTKLRQFIELNPAFASLPELERERMIAQQEAMKSYLSLLRQRYSAATGV